MYRTRTRMLIAAALMTAVAVGLFSAIGIVAQDSTPTPELASGSPVASPVGSTGPEIDLVDIGFDPKGFTIPANTPTVVTIVNKGAAVHNLTIDALNVYSGDLQPGQSMTLTIDAPAGTYTFYCTIPGHREAGMAGTLTVT